MYYLSDVSVTVQVPPNRFGERIDRVVLELAREKFENSIFPEIGTIVAVLSIRSLMPGKIVPGEGSTFHDVIFAALTFRPLKGEYIAGEVAEVTKFGIFIRVGCTDCLCHISQLSDDKFALSERGKGVLVGRETDRRVQLGDRIRAKIINAQIDRSGMKIATTCRDPLLGNYVWIEEAKAGVISGTPVGDVRHKLRKKKKKKKGLDE